MRTSLSRGVPSLVLSVMLLLSACGGKTSEPSPESAEPAVPTLDAAIGKLRGGDLAGAEEALARVTADDPSNARAWRLLGLVRRRQDDVEGALAAYRRAVEVDPEQYAAVYGLAALQALRGETEEALARLAELKESGKYDLSQISLDDDLKSLRDDERYQDLLMRKEDFLDPFVEPAKVIHEWQGEGAGDEFGWIARNVGDVDGDGTNDLVASAPSWNESSGRIYVYSGKSGELLWQASGEKGHRLGASVDTAGDVDGDGVGDVVAGAPGGERAVVYAGASGEVLFTFDGDQKEASYGYRVRGVDDVDGDGHGDVLVGTPHYDVGEGEARLENAGRAVLYSGADGSALYEWTGDEAGERLGASLAGGVRDGRIFLILGAPDAGEEDRGKVYVYDALADEPRFVIESDDKGAELGGMFLSVVGDVDADGVADVYASDWQHGALGPVTGQIVVHSGADGHELLKLTGEAPGDGFGIGPAQAGDVDGDGHDDLIVGAWQHASAAPAGGKVYLYSGRDGSLLRAWTCKVMGDTFGFDATGMGDVDGDGKIDFLLTSAWSAVHGAKSGRMFLLGL